MRRLRGFVILITIVGFVYGSSADKVLLVVGSCILLILCFLYMLNEEMNDLSKTTTDTTTTLVDED